MKSISFVIPLQPVSKKNSQRIIRCGAFTRIAPSKAYVEYEDAAGVYVGRIRPDIPIDYPVNVEAHFYMCTRRRCDLTNMLESIDDILVKYCILADDCYRVLATHDGSFVSYDKEFPRTVVRITPKHDGWAERMEMLSATDGK